MPSGKTHGSRSLPRGRRTPSRLEAPIKESAALRNGGARAGTSAFSDAVAATQSPGGTVEMMFKAPNETERKNVVAYLATQK